MFQKRNGFTLRDSSFFIEAMIVIVIIGILASIAILMYLDGQDRIRIEAVKHNARIVEFAVNDYAVSHDNICPTLEELQTHYWFSGNNTLKNPFTGKEEIVTKIGWAPGSIGYRLEDSRYTIEGYGKAITDGFAKNGVVIVLTNGI